MRIDEVVVISLSGDVERIRLGHGDITIAHGGENLYSIRVRGRTLELEQQCLSLVISDEALRALGARRFFRGGDAA